MLTQVLFIGDQKLKRKTPLILHLVLKTLKDKYLSLFVNLLLAFWNLLSDFWLSDKVCVSRSKVAVLIVQIFFR